VGGNDEKRAAADKSGDLDAGDVLTLEGAAAAFLKCSNNLKIVIPEWLSGMLRIERGAWCRLVEFGNALLEYRPTG
jgi:hypothetical protein